MSDKPKIYGYCDAGCKWEVPHKDEVNVKSKRYDVTLLASNWENSVYIWECDAITATCPIELLPHTDCSFEEVQALQKANILGGYQFGADDETGETGFIELVALGTVPTIDIPVTFIVRGDL